MNKLVLFLVCLCSVGCTSFKYQSEHFQSLSNFTYKTDLELHGTPDKWVTYESPYTPFTGDCEDYSFTLQNAIGGQVWHVIHPKWKHHAVLVLEGVVYDNTTKYPSTLGSYDAVFVREMVFTGKITEN